MVFYIMFSFPYFCWIYILQTDAYIVWILLYISLKVLIKDLFN